MSFWEALRGQLSAVSFVAARATFGLQAQGTCATFPRLWRARTRAGAKGPTSYPPRAPIVALAFALLLPLVAPAQTALQRGDYATARAQLADSLDAGKYPYAPDYAETFRATGEYEQGLNALQAHLADAPQHPSLYHAEGLLLVELGRYEDAERAFRTAANADPNYFANLLALGDLYRQTGRARQAAQVYFPIYRTYQQNTLRTADALALAAQAAAHLGEFRAANDAFRTSVRIDPQEPRTLRWWADLFEAKYNTADAQRTYEEALALNPNDADTWVGYAASQGSFVKQEELAQRALALNPNHVGALAILARLRLLDAQYDDARAVVDRALVINPNSVATLGYLAAIHHLQDAPTAFAEAEARARAVNPQPTRFYLVLAEVMDLRFRYADAVTFATQAARTDRSSAEAYARLGTSLLRTGQFDQARRYLERAFDRDPYNLFAGNTLTMLDAFAGFARLESDHFVLRLPADEADVTGPLMLETAEAAFAEMRTRYPYEPEGKILIEAYGDHDDFAVRVGGVPHLGLLGVAFGDIVAMDTPRAQAGDDYNWARTLWHELAHTMAIGVSQHRVPRWFTEGLSVYEERRAFPHWQRALELDLFAAFDQDRLLPLADINQGFTRPTFPGQILLSYYHASKVIDFLVREHGFEAIVGLMQAFAQGLDEAAAFQQVLGQSRAAVDRAFRADLRAQRTALAPVLDGMANPFAETPATEHTSRFFETLETARNHRATGRTHDAEAAFREAIRLYPRYVGGGNPYEGLAAIYRARADTAQLRMTLEAYLAQTPYAPDALRELGDLYAATGNTHAARRTYRRAFDIAPYDPAMHELMAQWYAAAGDHVAAIRARRAVLALDPVDRAAAYYHLAEALLADGQATAAKRAVLQALEEAPGFRDAQRLLLTLVEGGAP